MQKVIGPIFGLKDLQFRHDDDFSDRLSRRHTTTLLLVFALVVTTKIYVGEPIKCWCPAHFTDSHKSYADIICWVQNSYFVAFSDRIPLVGDNKEHLSYYQWVPLILLGQAIMFYLPSIAWKFMCRRSGLNISAVMEAAITGQRSSYADIREKSTRYMVHMIDRYLTSRIDRRQQGFCNKAKHAVAKYCCLIYGKFYGNYLTVNYLVIKFLYCLNAIGQLYLLDIFLGTNYHMYGIDVLTRFFSGSDWLFSNRFPRVTMCNFGVRRQTEVHTYQLQCVLSVNLFNEKIFLCVWFWLVLISIVSLIGLFKWTWSLTFWDSQVSYCRRQLRAIGALGPDTKRDKDVVRKFVQNYLRRDGVFMIRLISNNVGQLVSAEVLEGLWENYAPNSRPRTPTAVPLNSLADRLENV